MRTDLKVGVICLFALVLACVGFFAYRSNKPGKDVGAATPARTAANNALSVGAPSDAPTTAPSTALVLPAPSGVSGFGPSHALGADTFTGTIAPPSPTTAPSNTSLVPPSGSTGMSCSRKLELAGRFELVDLDAPAAGTLERVYRAGSAGWHESEHWLA